MEASVANTMKKSQAGAKVEADGGIGLGNKTAA